MRAGFMLLELALILVCMGIIFCLAFPTMYSLNHSMVRIELENLRSHLITLQQHALVKRTIPYKELPEITFDINTDRYYVNNKSYQLSQGVHFKVLPHIKGPPAKPSHKPTSPVTFIDQQVTMYPTGMRTGGTIYLSDNTGSCQYAATVSADVIPHVRCYRYDKSWQRLP